MTLAYNLLFLNTAKWSVGLGYMENKELLEPSQVKKQNFQT